MMAAPIDIEYTGVTWLAEESLVEFSVEYIELTDWKSFLIVLGWKDSNDKAKPA
jgi:hypothetical protein